MTFSRSLWFPPSTVRSFPGDSDGKESAYNAGHLGSIPGLGRAPGEEHGNPLQDTGLENPMDREEPEGLQSIALQNVGHN